MTAVSGATIMLDGKPLGALNELDEAVATAIAKAKEPKTFEWWAWDDASQRWRTFTVVVEPGNRSYYIQGAPILLEEMGEFELQAFAWVHAAFPELAGACNQ